MKRQAYKGYIIDRDNLGRIYIYNTESPYNEDCDREIVYNGNTVKAAKELIDQHIWEKERTNQHTWDEESSI